MKPALLLLALALGGCNWLRQANERSQDAHPFMGAPMATTGSGIDPNLGDAMNAEAEKIFQAAETVEEKDGVTQTPTKGSQLEKKEILVEADGTGKRAFIDCLLSKDWILVKKDDKGDGEVLYTFLRPASTRVNIEPSVTGQMGIEPPKK